jgi:hypothetical protein
VKLFRRRFNAQIVFVQDEDLQFQREKIQENYYFLPIETATAYPLLWRAITNESIINPAFYAFPKGFILS